MVRTTRVRGVSRMQRSRVGGDRSTERQPRAAFGQGFSIRQLFSYTQAPFPVPVNRARHAAD